MVGERSAISSLIPLAIIVMMEKSSIELKKRPEGTLKRRKPTTESVVYVLYTVYIVLVLVMYA